MGHSHLAIRHLVRQLESGLERKSARRPAPEWLLRLVGDLAEHFEPFSGVARVGFEFQQGDAGWEITLFLGENEVVGGPEDGETRPVNFRFNLLDVPRRFDRIDRFAWNAFPGNAHAFDDGGDLSLLTMEGLVGDQKVSLQVLAGPPESLGPAIRQHPDGRMELA